MCAGGGAAAWWWNAKRHRDPAPAALPWYRDGLAALHNGSYHRASKALARAVEIDPSYAMAHAYLAEAWYELDYLERAKDELLKAMARAQFTVSGRGPASRRNPPDRDWRFQGARRRNTSNCPRWRHRTSAAVRCRPGPRAGTQPGHEEGHGNVFRSDSPGCAERRRLAAPGSAAGPHRRVGGLRPLARPRGEPVPSRFQRGRC